MPWQRAPETVQRARKRTGGLVEQLGHHETGVGPRPADLPPEVERAAMWQGWKGDLRAVLIGLALVPVLFYGLGLSVMAIMVVTGEIHELVAPAREPTVTLE